MSMPRFVGTLYIGQRHRPKFGSRAGLNKGITVHAVDRKESYEMGSEVLISTIKLSGGWSEVIVWAKWKERRCFLGSSKSG